jgi:hypothetical protein
MLKGLKILGLIPRKGLHPIYLFLLIAGVELLVLAWITWVIFHT